MKQQGSTEIEFETLKDVEEVENGPVRYLLDFVSQGEGEKRSTEERRPPPRRNATRCTTNCVKGRLDTRLFTPIAELPICTMMLGSQQREKD